MAVWDELEALGECAPLPAEEVNPGRDVWVRAATIEILAEIDAIEATLLGGEKR